MKKTPYKDLDGGIITPWWKDTLFIISGFIRANAAPPCFSDASESNSELLLYVDIATRACSSLPPDELLACTQLYCACIAGKPRSGLD
jgi:hypothetical protein